MSTAAAPHRIRPGRALIRPVASEMLRRLRVQTSGLIHRVRCGRPTVGSFSLDPFDSQVIADPYGWFRALHEAGGISYFPTRRLWIISRYEDVRKAARSAEILSSASGVAESQIPLPMMLTLDRPDHSRLRRVVSREFSREAIGELRPFLERLTERSIAPLLDATNDAVAGLAAPLPVAVIAEVLGVSQDDLPSFRRWSDQIVKGLRVGGGALGRGERAIRTTVEVFWALRSLDRYFTHEFSARRLEPSDDVLSRLLFSTESGSLSDLELFWFALLLLLAGNETTSSLIGTTLLAFGENPDQYALLRQRPELAQAAIDEALRYHSPIQGFYRSARQDYEVGSTTIPAGARVLLLFAAANRDPLQFSEPDRFLIDRAPSEHLAFGSGVHHCLGAQLARLEMTVVLEYLITNVASIELAGEPVWDANPSLRGLEHLPLELHRA